MSKFLIKLNFVCWGGRREQNFVLINKYDQLSSFLRQDFNFVDNLVKDWTCQDRTNFSCNDLKKIYFFSMKYFIYIKGLYRPK